MWFKRAIYRSLLLNSLDNFSYLARWQAENASRHKVSANGNAQLNGSGAVVLNGSNDTELDSPDSGDWDITSDSMTWEIKFKPTSLTPPTLVFASQYQDASNRWRFNYNTVLSRIEFSIRKGAVWVVDEFRSFTIVSGTEYYLALKKSGSTYSFWIDGVQIGSSFTSSETTAFNSLMRIGEIGDNSSWMIGEISYVRFSKGIARDVSVVPVGSPVIDIYTVLALDFSGTNGSTRIIDLAKPLPDSYTDTFDTGIDLTKWTLTDNYGGVSVTGSTNVNISATPGFGSSGRSYTSVKTFSGAFSASMKVDWNGMNVSQPSGSWSLARFRVVISGVFSGSIDVGSNSSLGTYYQFATVNGSASGSATATTAGIDTLTIERLSNNNIYLKYRENSYFAGNFSQDVTFFFAVFAQGGFPNPPTTSAVFDDFVVVQSLTAPVLPDSSSNGKDLTQLTVSRQPTYSSTPILLDITNDDMDLGSKLITTGSYSMYAVVNPDTLHVGYIWSQGFGATNALTGIRFKSNGKIGIDIDGFDYESTLTYTAGTNYVISMIFNQGTSMKAYLNGVEYISIASPTDGFFGDQFSLFSSVDASTVPDFNGKMFEVSFRSGADSNGTRTTVENLLQQKYFGA